MINFDHKAFIDELEKLAKKETDDQRLGRRMRTGAAAGAGLGGLAFGSGIAKQYGLRAGLRALPVGAAGGLMLGGAGGLLYNAGRHHLGMDKKAVKLSPEEQKRQMLQFAGLGAAAAPVIQTAKNLITHGKVSPFTSVPKFVASQALGGAAAGGVIPVIQHGLERKMQDEARERARVDRLQRQMTQVKSAAVRAGGIVGGSILKTAVMNLTGRDNRTPFIGGTQFPTEGSKSKAKQFGQAAKSKAEVGPAPLMGKLNKTNMTTVDDVAVKMPTAKGSLPKVGG